MGTRQSRLRRKDDKPPSELLGWRKRRSDDKPSPEKEREEVEGAEHAVTKAAAPGKRVKFTCACCAALVAKWGEHLSGNGVSVRFSPTHRADVLGVVELHPSQGVGVFSTSC